MSSETDVAARCRDLVAVAAVVIVAVASSPSDRADAAPAEPRLEIQIADLKAKTATLVASARAHLEALSPQERLAAPSVIWRVPDAISGFRDCADCPQMVIIPAGEFTMGAPPGEVAGATQHRVTISAPFAVSKFEITFDEWDRCVTEDGCEGYRPGDETWGRNTRPVINVSWLDAKAYVNWLSKKTGQVYRLLSESEWEYAARAGTTTTFSTGDSISPSTANFDGSPDGTGPSDVNRQRTVPVGSFPANGFGLHDMHGNVSEWVEDCWYDDYSANTPNDGSPSLEGNCNGHVVRGGSWEDSDSELRSAARTGGDKTDRFYSDGIRIARSL